MAQFVLLSGSSAVPAADLHRSVVEAGMVVLSHVLGTAPGVDFAPVAAAIIDLGDRIEPAIAQTRRWRAELGDEVVPIAWVLPAASAEAIVAGFAAGADVVLARPVTDFVLVAQLRSMSRARSIGERLAARAGEARLIGEQLRKAFAEIDCEREAARLIQRACVPRILPELGRTRIAVCHLARNRLSGDFYDARHLDTEHIGFFVGDVIGGRLAASMLGMFVAYAASHANREAKNSIAEPGEVLTHVNRELLRLGLEERPLLALLAGALNASTGELKLARAGLPAPIYLTTGGDAAFLNLPGPFLGTAETTYITTSMTLRPGDKLVVATDAARLEVDATPGDYAHLREAVLQHRTRAGQAFVDAVANMVVSQVRHEDDVTVMVVEMA